MKKLLASFLSVLTVIAFATSLFACSTTKSYTVSFVVDGETYKSITATDANSINFPQDPTKANHTFNGWFLDDGVWAMPFNEETLSETTVDKNFSVYAKFTVNTITGVTFDDVTTTYNGESVTIEVANLPENATVTYEPANTYTNAGSYPVTATVTLENHLPTTLNATLTINKAIMNGVTFADTSIMKDGESHTITATGYPEGSIVTYSNEGPYTEKGTYDIGVTIENDNYETFTKTATLVIKDISDILPSKKYGAFYSDYYTYIEFTDDNYTKANYYCSDVNGSSSSTTDYTVTISPRSDGTTRIFIEKGKFGFRGLIDQTGSIKVDLINSSASDSTTLKYKAISKKPTLVPYGGMTGLDITGYTNGATFNPTGWKEEIMNAETGEYELAQNQATYQTLPNDEYVTLKCGQSAQNVHRYTYTFEKTQKGPFYFYYFEFDYSAFLNYRVSAITEEGGTFYLCGSSSSFVETGAYATTAKPQRIHPTTAMQNVKSLVIELYYSESGTKTGDFDLYAFNLSLAQNR